MRYPVRGGLLLPMTAPLAFLPLSLALAMLIGFSMERANICTVKAVEEVLTTKRAYLFASFAKTVLWIMVLTVPLLWLMPGARAQPVAWSLSIYSFAGGVIFGLGAFANGGCAFSTLSKLASGRIAMLVTLLAFWAGAVAQTLLMARDWLPTPLPATAHLSAETHWVTVLFAFLVIWAVWELVRLGRTQPSGTTFGQNILADRYRLSTAAVLIGLSNAVLFTLSGSWLYTTVLIDGGRYFANANITIDPARWGLVAALVVGAVMSTVQGRRFRLDWRPDPAWIGNLVGGFLMGLGAAMIPGGNAVLILASLPNLAVHAVPAFLGIVIGIVLPLIVLRWTGGTVERVDCGGDICRT